MVRPIGVDVRARKPGTTQRTVRARCLVPAVLAAVGVVGALLIWQMISAAVGPYKLPSPTSLWPAIFNYLFAQPLLVAQGLGSSGLWPHLVYTTLVALSATVVGTAVGLVIAIASLRLPRLGVLLQTWTGVLRAIPPIAAIPFALLWFGPTLAAQMIIVVLYVAGMATVSALQAAKNVDPIFARSAGTLGASSNRILWTVTLPSIVPTLVGGVRVAFGVAVGIEVVAEYLGSSIGIGQVFSRMVPYQALGVIIVGILWITLLVFLIDKLFLVAARRLTKWVP